MVVLVLIVTVVTACTVQGMARAQSGQALAWPLSSGRSVRRGSRVKRDFACTLTKVLSPVPVVLRSQSRLNLEGRTRILSGPSPALYPHHAIWRQSIFDRRSDCRYPAL